MKNLKSLRIISSSILLGFIVMLNPIGANAEWKQDSNGWWNTEGSSYSIGWKEIDGNWYYFWGNGYMAHDTTVDGYKLGSDGAWIQGIENDSQTSSNNSGNFNVDQLVNSIKNKFKNVIVEDVKTKAYFLSAPARKLIKIDDQGIYVDIYNSNEEMEKDALNVPSDGSGTVDYVCSINYFKKGNIIVHYAGDNKSIISCLKEIFGKQFAGDGDLG